MRLSKNFNLNEFTCPCKNKNCKKDELPNPKLLILLQELRDKIQMPIYISIGGGIRCRSYNASVGGYANSPHVFGKAADISVEGMTLSELAKICISIGFLRIGIYTNHLHVDVVTPHTSRFWYVKKYGSKPVYSGREYDLEKFLKKVR